MVSTKEVEVDLRHLDELDFDSVYRELLTSEGINAKGYGILYKYPMLDPELSWKAKAVYSYICSLAGSGETAFPGYKTILYDLDIKKDSYYGYRDALEQNGYLKAQQRSFNGQFLPTLFTVVSRPKKFIADMKKQGKPDYYIKNGMEADGYGLIPRTVMLDTRLKIGSKVLYSYYCAFAGRDIVVTPVLDDVLFHLGISDKTYRKYRDGLELHGYITVEQYHENGRFSVPCIILNRFPLEQEQENDNKKSNIIFINKPKQGGKKQNEKNKIQGGKKPETVVPQTTKNQCFDGNSSSIQGGKKPERTNGQGGKKQERKKPETTINRSTIINTTIDLSIHQESENKKKIDGLIESCETDNNLENSKTYRFRMAVSDKSESKVVPYTQIESTLFTERTLPFEYRNNKDQMDLAIQIISESDLMDNFIDNNKDNDTYRFAVHALTDLCMLPSNEVRSLNGSKVSYSDVFKQINECLKEQQSIRPVLECAVESFLSIRNIRNPLIYMQNCIWTAFFDYKVRFNNFIYEAMVKYYDKINFLD